MPQRFRKAPKEFTDSFERKAREELDNRQQERMLLKPFEPVP
jgi:hypothetical protein